MAKLYLLAVNHDAPLQPTFARLPHGVRNAAMHVVDLAEARRMEPDELGAILDDLAVILGSQVEPVYEPEPPRAPELPMQPATDEGDPNAWRSEVEDGVAW